MIDEKKLIEDIREWNKEREIKWTSESVISLLESAPKISGWISCSEKMPENEQEVEITYTRQHYLTGEKLYLTARAFHEDGTLTTENSAYGWENTGEWEYDEKTDSCIIPEGWYESVSFADEFGIVDMPVIAWRPLTEPYKEKQ